MTLPRLPGAGDPLFVELQEALKGRYSLLSELGRGGMGIVYLAREVRLDRLVALKLLPPALAENAELRERFLREARTAARLSQPNIVPIFAADEAGPFVFYAMAHIEGETVADLLARRGALPAAEATRLLREVAWALGYAHGQQVVHRDIKPENILIERESGRALVTDFGIAKLTDGAESGGRAVGTPAYMSPEQAAGESVDGRTDLYALGVVAFQLLAGRLPFEGAGAAVLAQKLTAAAPALLDVAPATPAALGRIVDRCLQRRREDRFATAEELVAALEAATAAPSRLPAPLARWFVSGENLRASDAFLSTLATAPFFVLLELMADGLFTDGGFELVPALAIALGAPLALWGVARWAELRRMLKAGFRRADLARGIRAAAQAQYADAEPVTGVALHIDRVGRWGAAAGLVGGGVWLAATVLEASAGPVEVAAAGYTTLASWVAAWRVVSSGSQALKRKALEWRARLWDGTAGRVAAWLGGGERAGGAGLLNRPTELALGGAADALFEALPAEVRKQLPGFGDVVRRLEARAQAARAAGDDAALAEAVTALENLRLDLLRLSAGTAVLGGMTADLEAARRLGAEVDGVLEAGREADRLFRNPTPA